MPGCPWKCGYCCSGFDFLIPNAKFDAETRHYMECHGVVFKDRPDINGVSLELPLDCLMLLPANDAGERLCRLHGTDAKPKVCRDAECPFLAKKKE